MFLLCLVKLKTHDGNMLLVSNSMRDSLRSAHLLGQIFMCSASKWDSSDETNGAKSEALNQTWKIQGSICSSFVPHSSGTHQRDRKRENQYVSPPSPSVFYMHLSHFPFFSTVTLR